MPANKTGIGSGELFSDFSKSCNMGSFAMYYNMLIIRHILNQGFYKYDDPSRKSLRHMYNFHNKNGFNGKQQFNCFSRTYDALVLLLFIWHLISVHYTPYNVLFIAKTRLYGIISSNLNLKTPK